MKCLFLLLFIGFGAIAQNNKLKIKHLTGDVYLYTTTQLFSGTPFPSNSMYVVTDAGVVLIDTPWDKEQFQPLLDSIKKKHNKDVVLCIATHFHADRTAGLEYYSKKGIKTYTSKLTDDLSKASGDKRAGSYFVKDTVFTVGGKRFETFYPGEGHTKDNITMWLPEQRILYGGCLVKSVENSGLGNVADANIAAWDDSIKALLKKYRSIAYIIPGHFEGSRGRKALRHTIKILRKAGG